MSGSTTQEVRELVHRAHDLEPGERLVLLKGLVPRLVQDLGVVGFSELLLELHTKGQRFEEARTHPGEGSEQRQTPGEPIGGPTPGSQLHLEEPRDVNRPGGRTAERAYGRIQPMPSPPPSRFPTKLEWEATR